MSTPLLSGTGVHKRYGRKLALAGVDLTVGAVELVALVGENGSGKTTLLRICAGLVAPDSGPGTCAGADWLLSARNRAVRSAHRR